MIESQPFGDLDLICKPGVLIPRWETEEWTLYWMNVLKDQRIANILDLCTGTGAIALQIAASLDSHVRGLDLNQRAVNLARRNKDRNQDKLAGLVELCVQDLFDVATQEMIIQAEAIAMNPPYVPQYEAQSISLSARRYEPRDAIIPDSSDAEIFYRHVVKVLAEKPHQARELAFEIGSTRQAKEVATMIRTIPHWSAKVWQDSAGRDRCVFGSKSRNSR